MKGLNVRKVRLALSRFARLAYEAFYKAVGHVLFMGRDLPQRDRNEKIKSFYEFVDFVFFYFPGPLAGPVHLLKTSF